MRNEEILRGKKYGLTSEYSAVINPKIDFNIMSEKLIQETRKPLWITTLICGKVFHILLAHLLYPFILLHQETA